MKLSLFVILTCAVLSACASRNREPAPRPVAAVTMEKVSASIIRANEGLKKAQYATASAKAKADAVLKAGALPNDPIVLSLVTDLAESEASQKETEGWLTNSQQVALTLSGQVEKLGAELEKSRAGEAYWHAKQVKALKELWFWRGLAGVIVAIAVASVLAFFGIRFARAAV